MKKNAPPPSGKDSCSAFSGDMRTCRDCSDPRSRACFKPLPAKPKLGRK